MHRISPPAYLVGFQFSLLLDLVRIILRLDIVAQTDVVTDQIEQAEGLAFRVIIALGDIDAVFVVGDSFFKVA